MFYYLLFYTSNKQCMHVCVWRGERETTGKDFSGNAAPLQNEPGRCVTFIIKLDQHSFQNVFTDIHHLEFQSKIFHFLD